jgi:hypothetical protein
LYWGIAILKTENLVINAQKNRRTGSASKMDKAVRRICIVALAVIIG